jgi:hypothetical protein
LFKIEYSRCCISILNPSQLTFLYCYGESGMLAAPTRFYHIHMHVKGKKMCRRAALLRPVSSRHRYLNLFVEFAWPAVRCVGVKVKRCSATRPPRFPKQEDTVLNLSHDCLVLPEHQWRYHLSVIIALTSKPSSI